MESGKGGSRPDNHTAIRYGRHRLDHPSPNLDRRKKGPHEAAQGGDKKRQKGSPDLRAPPPGFRGRRCRCAIVDWPAGPFSKPARSRPAQPHSGTLAAGTSRKPGIGSPSPPPRFPIGRDAQRQPARTAPAKVTIPARGRRPGGTRRRVSRVAHCQITPSARGRLFYDS